MRATRALAVLVAVLTATAAGCARPTVESARPVLVERARVSMGSDLRLSAWTADESRAVAAFNAVFAEFDRLEALMSVWRGSSDLERLHAAAGRSPVPVSADP